MKKKLMALGVIGVVLGGIVVSDEADLKEVPKEAITYTQPASFHEFRNNETGEITAFQISPEEYNVWITKSMTIPNYPQPYLEGYTWVKTDGNKIDSIVTPTILKEGEYLKLTEDTATTTATYKVNEKGNIRIVSEKP